MKPSFRGLSGSFKKTFVESSNISALAYDEFIETLTVWFKSGAEYDYVAVPSETANEFLDSPSKGWYFKNRIVPNYEHMVKQKSLKKTKEEDAEDKSENSTDNSG